MSDLKWQTLAELHQSKSETELHIRSLKNELQGQQIWLKWIEKHIASKIEVKQVYRSATNGKCVLITKIIDNNVYILRENGTSTVMDRGDVEDSINKNDSMLATMTAEEFIERLV